MTIIANQISHDFKNIKHQVHQTCHKSSKRDYRVDHISLIHAISLFLINEILAVLLRKMVSVMWRESRLLLWSQLVIQHFKCHVRNASLLQNDRDVDTRNTNLQNARTKYQLEQKTFNLLEDQRVQVNLVDIPPLVSIYAIM